MPECILKISSQDRYANYQEYNLHRMILYTTVSVILPSFMTFSGSSFTTDAINRVFVCRKSCQLVKYFSSSNDAVNKWSITVELILKENFYFCFRWFGFTWTKLLTVSRRKNIRWWFCCWANKNVGWQKASIKCRILVAKNIWRP